MSTPVTRGELREELGLLEERVDRKLEALEGRLESRFDHKLEMWGGALLARIESSEQRLIAELGRHVRAVEESMRAQIAALDDKYAHLAARVRRKKPSS